MSNHNDREVLPLFLYNTWAEMEVQCQEIERFIEELTDSIRSQISVLESKRAELSDIKQILESLRNLEKSKLAKKQIEIDRVTKRFVPSRRSLLTKCRSARLFRA